MLAQMGIHKKFPVCIMYRVECADYSFGENVMMSKIASLGGAVSVGVALILACSQASATPPGTGTPAKQTSKPASPTATRYEGPFGLAKGISGAELVASLGFVNNVEINPFSYSGQPPKPVQGIEDYSVIATPKAGLCQIGGSVKVKAVNGSGDQLKAAVDKYAALLELKYGSRFEKTDDVKDKVYRKNPQFWMVGLQENSVSYRYIWSNSTSPLPNQLKRVIITARATGITGGYASIQYHFDNAGECVAELQAFKAADM